MKSKRNSIGALTELVKQALSASNLKHEQFREHIDSKHVEQTQQIEGLRDKYQTLLTQQQQEIETLKAENERLKAENQKLAQRGESRVVRVRHDHPAGDYSGIAATTRRQTYPQDLSLANAQQNWQQQVLQPQTEIGKVQSPRSH